MELIIVLLMFAFPITVAIIGNSKNNKKSSSTTKNIQPSSPIKEVYTYPVVRERKAAPSEGESSIHHTKNQSFKNTAQMRHETQTAEPASTGKSKEEIKAEKKKLIIYSEILRPKFDE